MFVVGLDLSFALVCHSEPAFCAGEESAVGA
jgi:hypothetical protein